MPARISPEPTPEERDAILAAVRVGPAETPGGWVETALAEGVEQDDGDP